MQHDEFHPVLNGDDFVEICIFVQFIAMFTRERCLTWIFFGEIHKQRANTQVGLVRLELLLIYKEHDFVLF